MQLTATFLLSALIVAPAVHGTRVCSRRPTASGLVPTPAVVNTPTEAANTEIASTSSSSSAAAATPPVAPPSSGGASLKPLNLVAPSTSGALSALKFTNVGASGSYEMITGMATGSFPTCDVKPSCTTSTHQVSGGPLAPFDEGLGFSLRGPIQADQIAVYQPNADGSSWDRVSSWAAGQKPNNLVFLNNKGGDESGTWSICQGASQSFASGDFTKAVKSANEETSSGFIPGNQEINILTGQACTAETCPGFFRGEAYAGWKGSKMLVVEFEMPSKGSDNIPAIWALNDQVYHSAQYGCNCRGMGTNERSKGGCGELDILEVLPSSDVNRAFSEMYSVKGATGSGSNYFVRPTAGKQVYAVIFDTKTDSVMIQRWSSFDFTSSLARGLIDGYLDAAAHVVPFNQNKRRSHRRGLHHDSHSF